jgi:hypothetical protein
MNELVQLQSFIDEHKSELSDEIYTKICEYNLKAFNKEQNCFYKVSYDILSLQRNFRDNLELVKTRKTGIIRIPEHTFSKFLRLITEDVDTENHPEMDIIYRQLDITPIYLSVEGDILIDKEDEDEESVEYYRKLRINNCCIINSIVKL